MYAFNPLETYEVLMTIQEFVHDPVSNIKDTLLHYFLIISIQIPLTQAQSQYFKESITTLSSLNVSSSITLNWKYLCAKSAKR